MFVGRWFLQDAEEEGDVLTSGADEQSVSLTVLIHTT